MWSPFMEPDSAGSYSQEHINRPCPEPVESSPHPHNLFKIRFNIILPPTSTFTRWSLLRVFRLIFWMYLLCSHVYYMSHPPHTSISGSCCSRRWVETMSLTCSHLQAHLFVPEMIWIWNHSEIIQGKTTWRKPVLVPLSIQSVHGLAQMQSQVSVVRGWQLTAWGKARPILYH